MNDKLLISIIMPAYNCEKYIVQAIESVLKQTYTNWELIIINDCSTDGTSKKISEFTAKDERIILVENEVNSGVSISRNKGISVANGTWIAFLDSDDIWANDKLEKQVELVLKTGKASLVFTGSAFVNEDGKRADYILHVPAKVNFKELLKQNIISCSSVLVKKGYVEMFSMPGDFLHEDYTVWLRILQSEEYAYGIDEPLLIYRVSSSSKSGNKLNAVKMQYRVYQYIGLNFFEIIYYMSCYAIRNLKKYKNIHKTI